MNLQTKYLTKTTSQKKKEYLLVVTYLKDCCTMHPSRSGMYNLWATHSPPPALHNHDSRSVFVTQPGPEHTSITWQQPNCQYDINAATGHSAVYNLSYGE